MSTSKLLKTFKKNKNNNKVDNKIFQFKDDHAAIEHAWCLKWVHAFTNTRDPLNWMEKRKNTSMRLN